MDLRFRLVVPKRPTFADITDRLFLRALNHPSPHFGMDELSALPGYDAEQKRFQRLLREYVEQWIDTGVFEDGTEDLAERGRLHNRWYRQGRLLPYAFEKSRALEAALSVVLEVFLEKPAASVSEDGLQIVFLELRAQDGGRTIERLG